MSTGVQGFGTSGWSIPPTGVTELYQRVLRETGDPRLADQAVVNAQKALDDLYHTAMVRTGGDQAASNQAVNQYSAQILRVAGLLPAIQGNDANRAGPALREAWGILQNAGITNKEAFHPWLHANVPSDDALRSAGFDPAEVHRPPNTPWAYADLDALT